jgi:hypothetical protein
MMTPDIEKIEHLLNAKSFGELSIAERELVLAHLSGAAEYEHMRDTLQRVKKVFTAEALALQTDAQLKEQILSRFEQNRPKPSSPFVSIITFFQTLIPSPAMRFASVLGLLVMIIGGSLFIFSPRKSEMAQTLEPQKTISTPPTDSFKEAETEIMANQQSVAKEKAVSTMTGPAVMDEMASTVTEKKVMYESMADEYLSPPHEAPRVAAEEVQPSMQNQIYRNDDGYLQYQNSRVAESSVKTKDQSDAYKDYASKPKKAEGKMEKAASAGNGQVTSQDISVSENEESTIALRGSRGSVEQKNISASIPVWPGVEKDVNPYMSTVEKIKLFLREELVNSYQKAPRLENNALSIQVTFTGKGKVSAVEVKGQVSEKQKDAIVNKTKELPTFKFTDGSKPTLTQHYVIIP